MKTYLLSIFCFISVSVFGQGYGNDWVVAGQTYYKVGVWERGIHRITGSQLLSSGVPTGADPRSLQVFRHGREQAIHVAGESDGRLDGSDYLEFYGIPNDGIRDSLFYATGKDRTNPYVALHCDTTYYFVTLRASGAGKRMATPPAGSTAGLSQEGYHLEEQLMAFKGYYPVGPTYPIGARYSQGMTMSSYDRGDGYMDGELRTGGLRNYSIPIQNAVITGPQPILETSIYGVTPDLHKVYYSVGQSTSSLRRTLDLSFIAYDLRREVNLPISWSDISASNLSLQVGSESGINGESVASIYHKLTYAQSFALPTSGGKRFNLSNQAELNCV